MAKKSAQAKAAEQDAPADEAPQEETAEQAPAARTASLQAEPEAEPEAPVGSESVSVLAAPLAAPESESEERLRQRLPHLGDPGSSTNPLVSNTGRATYPGTRHVKLVDHTGATLELTDLFTFPPQGSPSRLAKVNHDVVELFTYPRTTTVTRQLLYTKDTVISVDEADRVLRTYEYAAPDEIPQP